MNERKKTAKNIAPAIQTWQFIMYSFAFSLSMPLQSSNIKQMAANTTISQFWYFIKEHIALEQLDKTSLPSLIPYQHNIQSEDLSLPQCG
jgi:hypothetical protein